MAKKHQQRAHVSVRMKKEQEKKRQQRQAFMRKNGKKIMILAVAAVIVIVAAALAIDYFGGPKGAMRVFMGKVLDMQENTVVTNLGADDPAYYTLAWYTPRAGYVSDTEIFAADDENEQRLMYRAENEEEMVASITLAGLKQKTAAGYVEQLRAMADSMGAYTTLTEAREGELGGHHVHYIYTTTDNTIADEETGEIPDETTVSLIAYSDTIQDSCIYMGLTSRAYPKAQAPTEEMMVQAAEEFFADIEILQPDYSRK